MKDARVRIIVDTREKNLELIEYLDKLGLEISFAALPVGDYIISERVCIERKTSRDFENGIMSNRLFEQLHNLSQDYERPILIIEGNEFSLKENVIKGAILSIFLDYGIQVIQTTDYEDTASVIFKLAEREQKEEILPRIRGTKRAFTKEEWQLFVVSSLPGIGPKLAKRLIERFGSIKNIVNATAEEIMEVDKIGIKKAKEICEVLSYSYKK
ncbi:MAG: ERCC4 domain-containing protein [Candidatus Micrarchaeaceae archaeon]